MIQLSVALFFAGYMLMYAGIAHGGKYATHPWGALKES